MVNIYLAAFASLSENCSYLGLDNIRGQISVHIFAPNRGCCLSLHHQFGKYIYIYIYIYIYTRFQKLCNFERYMYLKYIFLNFQRLCKRCIYVYIHTYKYISRSSPTYRALYYVKIETHTSYIYKAAAAVKRVAQKRS